MNVPQAVVAGAKILVSAIWQLEVVNVLVVAERRKKTLPEKTANFIRGHISDQAKLSKPGQMRECLQMPCISVT
jgi:hypothetical protein